MCICFVHQREQLKLLLSAKEKDEGVRALETVRVQQRSHLVSENLCKMLKDCCFLTPDSDTCD